jgi:hypothetical protein
MRFFNGAGFPTARILDCGKVRRVSLEEPAAGVNPHNGPPFFLYSS